MPLVRDDAASVRDEIFGELTYHAAYEPQRAVRNQRYKYIRYYSDGGPVLANVDDSPTKDLMVSLGWADRPVDREQLYDLPLDPNEMRNVVNESAYADVRRQLSDRLDEWMRATADPLLDGDVPAPPGARINTRDQLSAEEPPVVVEAADPLAADLR
jgi:hypothetical protein